MEEHPEEEEARLSDEEDVAEAEEDAKEVMTELSPLRPISTLKWRNTRRT